MDVVFSTLADWRLLALVAGAVLALVLQVVAGRALERDLVPEGLRSRSRVLRLAILLLAAAVLVVAAQAVDIPERVQAKIVVHAGDDRLREIDGRMGAALEGIIVSRDKITTDTVVWQEHLEAVQDCSASYDELASDLKRAGDSLDSRERNLALTLSRASTDRRDLSDLVALDMRRVTVLTRVWLAESYIMDAVERINRLELGAYAGDIARAKPEIEACADPLTRARDILVRIPDDEAPSAVQYELEVTDELMRYLGVLVQLVEGVSALDERAASTLLPEQDDALARAKESAIRLALARGRAEPFAPDEVAMRGASWSRVLRSLSSPGSATVPAFPYLPLARRLEAP